MGELCVPGCRYRSLYEGSQSSLSDMAAKQSQAVTDHQGLRREIARVLKRYFAREYQQAERVLGIRLTEAPDDVLAAYLDDLLAVRHLGEALEGLRTALRAAGFTIPDGEDLEVWAQVVTGQAPSNARLTTPGETMAAESTPWSTPTTAPAVSAVLTDLGTGLSQPPGGVPSPVTPAITHTVQLLDTLDSLDTLDGLDDLDDLFDDTASDSPISGLGELFDEPVHDAGLASEGVWPSVGARTGLEGLFDGEPSIPATNTEVAVVPSMGLVLDDLFGPSTEPSNPGQPTALTTTRTLPLPLKPESVVGGTRKRVVRKPIRSRAVRADVPDDGPTVELDDRTRKALLAFVAIPRPVFVADLAEVAGSREVVEEWEAELRELKANSPVRFIGGKARHRLRGSLVLPAGSLRDASLGQGASWWHECVSVQKYPGTKLYELGVLLHRVGADLISAEFDDRLAVLRVNDRRGLVGMVVVLDNEFGAEEVTSKRIADALSGLVRERLSSVAVLAIHHEWEAALCQLVPELARIHDWKPNAPVVYANSWEWADDAGATAKLLISG